MKEDMKLLLIVVTIFLALMVGVLVWMRVDLGKEVFYIGMSFTAGIVTATVLFVAAMFMGRIAQKSDNSEIAMAGVGKMILEMESRRLQSEQRWLGQIADQRQAPPADDGWGAALPTSFNFGQTVEAPKSANGHNGNGRAPVSSNGHNGNGYHG